MERYLQAFVNFKQNDWGRLLSITKFTYNNAKNLNTGHTPFKLNCGYYPRVFFKEDTNPCFQSKLADKLSAKLWDLMTVCRENFYHARKLQKQAHNKGVKPRSYAFGDKVWLSSKYIKTKYNRKLEVKFFELFQVLHPIGKQAYKLKLSKQWKIYNIFLMSLLEQVTTIKEQVDKQITKLETSNSKEYKVKAIWNSAVYASKLESGQLPGLYYLVAWKGYPKEKNAWESLSAIQHLKKLINCFYKEHPEKSIATFPPIDSFPPIARPIVRPTPFKRKWGRPAGGTSKRARNWVFDTHDI